MNKTALRLEYKYLLSVDDLDTLRRMIMPFVEIDRFGRSFGREGYCVRSIYFDSPGLECFHEKEAGIKIRRKYRVRGYNRLDENSKVFLEIKRKYINHIRKNRAPVSWPDLFNLFSNHDDDIDYISFSENRGNVTDLRQFMYHYFSRGLRPMILINYEREAFFSRFDPGLRMTFDKNLRSAVFPNLEMLYDELPCKYSLHNRFILEIKFYDALPRWFQSVIKRFDISRLALSKYTICLNSHDITDRFSPRTPTGFSCREFPEYDWERNDDV